mgnify:CR=1 FL=1
MGRSDGSYEVKLGHFEDESKITESESIGMLVYIFKKLAYGLLVLFGVITVVFGIFNLGGIDWLYRFHRVWLCRFQRVWLNLVSWNEYFVFFPKVCHFYLIINNKN